MKKFFSQLFGKNKTSSGYLYDRSSFSKFPADNQHGRNKANRFDRLKKWRDARRRKDFTPGYGQSTPVRNTNVKAIGVIILIVAMLVAGGVAIRPWLASQFASMSLFQVHNVVYTGTNRVSKDKLRDASGIMTNKTNMFGVDTEAAGKKLAALPWVAQASVKRHWPSTIEIAVIENEAIALLHTSGSLGGQLHYIDKDGRPFLAVTPGGDIDFPVITGLTEVLDTGVKQRALTEVLTFLLKIKNNNPYLPTQLVSEIHVDDHGEMIVYLIDYPFPIFFGNGNTKEKVRLLEGVLKDLFGKRATQDLISQVRYIRMDYLDKDKVLVKKNGSG